MSANADPYLAAYLAEAAKIAATQNLSQDRRASTRNLSIIFSILAACFVAFRFSARLKQRAKYGWDDGLIILALVLLAGNLACTIIMVNNGLGLHSGALTLEEGETIGKVLLVNEPLYVTNVNVIKLSVVVLYYRIFPIRSIKLGALILGGISTVWNLFLIGLSQGQCNPREKVWAPWTPGTCINQKASFLAIAVPSILTDIAILILPLPQVWKLHTNRSQKISLSAIFLLGSFVVFASIYRFTVFVTFDPNDLPYTLAPGCAWNIIELSSGIISACLPTLGPLVRIAFRAVTSSSKSNKSTSNNNKAASVPTIGSLGKGQGIQNWNKLDDDAVNYGISAADLGLTHHENRITTSKSREDSGDEIPLTGIRQLKEWSIEYAGTNRNSCEISHDGGT